jgi:hypothetical protein
MKRVLAVLLFAGLIALPALANADSWRTIDLRTNATGGGTTISIGASADSQATLPIDLWQYGMPAIASYSSSEADHGNTAFTNVWVTATWTGAATPPNSPDTLIVYAQTSPNKTTWTTGEAIVTEGTGAISVAAGGAATSTAYIFTGSSQQLPIVPLRYLRFVFKNVGSQTAVSDLNGWVTYAKKDRD